ncbi:MAG: 16S rRNA (uracil(1498)-N(3))-methyltransferase, partial [Candidatus Omnitrophica bacterium]|nr:16S rRNA (uracil(1498)-N(3))-methyltransferase [Candidatus Omnitrophota bacterium]
QKIYIFDGKGKEWEYRISRIKQKNIKITKINKIREQLIIKPFLTLGFPLIQEKKIDFILQKATELGVANFIPYYSSRSRGSSPAAPTKINRWQKIIIEACRQSERLWLPKINQPLALNQLIKNDFNLKLVALPGKTGKIKINNKNFKNILGIVGPEGGFTDEEITACLKNNFKVIKLSSNILRTETAAIFLTGLIKYLTK